MLYYFIVSVSGRRFESSRLGRRVSKNRTLEFVRIGPAELLNVGLGGSGHRVVSSWLVVRASVGEWLSLVEHLVRDQGVGGSNPLSPTNSNQQLPKSPGVRGLPIGLTFALPAQVAPKTRATP